MWLANTVSIYSIVLKGLKGKSGQKLTIKMLPTTKYSFWGPVLFNVRGKHRNLRADGITRTNVI